MAAPDLARALRTLRAGRPAEALPDLTSAVASSQVIGPEHALQLEALIALGERAAARTALDAALRLRPGSADACDAMAFFARQLDRHELSNSLYRDAANLAPADAQIWYNLATSEQSLGRLEAAADACHKALELDPSMTAAAALRSEVARATEAANHVDDLASRIRAARDAVSAVPLFYALGKELHDLKRYDAAFDAFSRGASARRANLRYDVSVDVAKLRRIEEVFSGPVAAATGAPCRHIFIIGLPRSGTTLTERILSGLPGVRSNNETNNFAAALLRASPERGDDIFERASRADFQAVARGYEGLAASDGHPGPIIEKLPFNYLYLGAILSAMPDAPVIWVRRHPLDSCFAMYRTLFGAAYPFSYDFDDLTRYYAAYARLMDHWTRLYGDRITAVHYEDLVADPDQTGRLLADLCGLTWRAEALDLRRNASASLTASAAQVRGEIYQSSSGVWRAYHHHLLPLVERLRSAGVELSVEPEA